jgi:tagatose-1,6-bisphosphate aldolase
LARENGVLALRNQWEATLGRTANGNMVKEAGKQTIDSLRLCFEFIIVVLAFV